MEEATGLYRRDVTIGRGGGLRFAETIHLRQEASPDTLRPSGFARLRHAKPEGRSVVSLPGQQ